MGPLTTLKRCFALIGLACVLWVLPAILTDAGSFRIDAALADDDDDDRSSRTGDSSSSRGSSSGGSSSGGTSTGGSPSASGGGGSSGGGTSASGGGGQSASSSESSDGSSGRWSSRDDRNSARSGGSGSDLSSDDNVVEFNTGSWWQRPDAHAVRDEILAYNVPVAVVSDLESAGFKLLGQEILGELGFTLSRLRIPPGRSLRSALSAAEKAAPGIVFEANLVYRTASRAEPEGCAEEGCYGQRLLGWRQVPANCGSGIRIGMTDTAVDPNHPALRGQTVRTQSFDPYGGGSLPDHGTAVAGLLVGDPGTGFPGMLPGAGLYAADVFHSNEDGESYSTLASLVEGFEWLAGERVSVINVSMTGPPSVMLEVAVNRLTDRGVVLVAAAGNGGPSAAPAFPAAYGDVVSITAVDAELRPYRMANRGLYISFASPGVEIWSADADGDGLRRTGTSFAAAHASAIIADVIERQGADRIAESIAALQTGARDLGSPGKDPIFGWGLIQGAPTCRP